MKISDLTVGTKSVNLKGKIVEISEPRDVVSKTGNALRVATAALSDESGKIILSLWNEQIDMVGVNDLVQIENGYVTEYQGIKQLNIGRYGNIQVLTAYERRMYKILCSDCGTGCEVPYKPDPGRPVYCPECLAKSRQRIH